MRRLTPARMIVLGSLLASIALAGCAAGTATTAPASALATPAAAASGAAGGGSQAGAACAATDKTGTVDVKIADFKFDPATAQAKVGDVVTWTNNDSTAHSAVITDKGCETQKLDNGASGAIEFTAPGTYPYQCGIHPTMKGTIEVK
jgi:plastocyanin